MSLPQDLGAFVVQGIIALAAILTVWIAIARTTRERFRAVYAKLEIAVKEVTELKVELAKCIRAAELQLVEDRIMERIAENRRQIERVEDLIRNGNRPRIGPT